MWQPQLNAAARRIGRGQIWGRPTDQPGADTPKLQVVLDAIYANDAAVCAPHLATDGMDLTVVRMLKYWLVVMLRNNFSTVETWFRKVCRFKVITLKRDIET